MRRKREVQPPSEASQRNRRSRRSLRDRCARTKKERPRGSLEAFRKLTRQRPTLPHSCPCSTIGSEKLDFRVRDGIGYGLLDIATGNDGHPKANQSKVVRLRYSVRPLRASIRSLESTARRGSPAGTRFLECRGRSPPGLRTPSYNVCLRELGQAARPISTGLLRALQRFHIQPINLVVFEGPLVPCGRDT